jgi:uncharacterized membrane protein
MVRVNVVFFDSMEQGLMGTARGAVALFLLIALDGLWLLFDKPIYGPARKGITRVKKAPPFDWLAYASLAFVTISAVAVLQPCSDTEAALYGGLVGLTTSVSSNALIRLHFGHKWSLELSAIDIIWTVLKTAAISVFTYEVSEAAGLYPRGRPCDPLP